MSDRDETLVRLRTVSFTEMSFCGIECCCFESSCAKLYHTQKRSWASGISGGGTHVTRYKVQKTKYTSYLQRALADISSFDCDLLRGKIICKEI